MLRNLSTKLSVTHTSSSPHDKLAPWRKWKSRDVELPASHLYLLSQDRVNLAAGIVSRGDCQTVDQNVDIDDFALAVAETVPHAYKKHNVLSVVSRSVDRDLLAMIGDRVKTLLPLMQDKHILKIILSFDQIRGRQSVRFEHSGRYRLDEPQPFSDPELIHSLFNVLGHSCVHDPKLVVLLMRAYARSRIADKTWIRNFLKSLIITWNHIHLKPNCRDLVDICLCMATSRCVHPDFLSYVICELDNTFPLWDEQSIGDLCKALGRLKFGNELLFQVFDRELPYIIHEYQWWNLIDVAQLYLVLRWPLDAHREMIIRFGNEIWKYQFELTGAYVAKALILIACMDTSDRRTVRGVLRRVPRHLPMFSPLQMSECFSAAAMVGQDPLQLYGSQRGLNLYSKISRKLVQYITDVPSYSLVKCVQAMVDVRICIPHLLHEIVTAVVETPSKWTTNQLASIAKNFRKLEFYPNMTFPGNSIGVSTCLSKQSHILIDSYSDKMKLKSMGCEGLVDFICTSHDCEGLRLAVGQLEKVDFHGVYPETEPAIPVDDIILMLSRVRSLSEPGVGVSIQRLVERKFYGNRDAIKGLFRRSLDSERMNGSLFHKSICNIPDFLWHLFGFYFNGYEPRKPDKEIISHFEYYVEEFGHHMQVDDAIKILAISILVGSSLSQQLAASCTNKIFIANGYPHNMYAAKLLGVYLKLLDLGEISNISSLQSKTPVKGMLCSGDLLRTRLPVTWANFFTWSDSLEPRIVDVKLLCEDHTSIPAICCPHGVLQDFLAPPLKIPLVLLDSNIDVHRLECSTSFLQTRRLLGLSHVYQGSRESEVCASRSPSNGNSRNGIVIIPESVARADIYGFLLLDILERMRFTVRILGEDKFADIEEVQKLFTE